MNMLSQCYVYYLYVMRLSLHVKDIKIKSMSVVSKISVFILFIGFSVGLHSQEEYGNGIINYSDSTWSIKMGLRIQTLFLGNWEFDQNNKLQEAESGFLVRRARLKFKGFIYDPRLTYKVELGLSNRDMSGGSVHTSNTPRYVYDAMLNWNFYKNMTVSVGQGKLPGNRERVISSASLQLVDRSLLNARFNIDRDIGVQLQNNFTIGKQFYVTQQYAFSQGEGRNVTVANLGGYEHTFKVEVMPFGNFESKEAYVGADLKRSENFKLAIAAAYDINDRAVKDRGNMGSYMEIPGGFFESTISTLFVDAIAKYKGFSFMAEYVNRTSDKNEVRDHLGIYTGQEVKEGYGYNLATGYLLKSNWELAGRYTVVNINDFSETQYTFGVSKYLKGHKLKVQSDVSWMETSFNSKELMCRFQVEWSL